MEKIETSITVGDKIVEKKQITFEEIKRFADISGDYNPLHTNIEYAKESRFGGIIAHGMLLGGYISAIIGTKLPGLGTIYLSQELEFVAPAFVGDELSIQIIVEELMEKGKAKLNTLITNQIGKTIVKGYAIVKLPKC